MRHASPLLVVPFVLLAVPASAQVLVVGHVTGRDRQGLEDVTVVMVTDGKDGERVVTDPEGGFRLRVPAHGREQVLSFRSPRFGAPERQLRLDPHDRRQTASFPEMRVEITFEFLATARPSPPSPPPPPPPPPVSGGGPPTLAPRITGWQFLGSQDTEEPGFGLYSYLLLKRRASPGERTQALFLATIEALLAQVTPVDQLLPYRDKAELNVTYLPVRPGLTAQDDPAAILEGYDYGRARVLASVIADATGEGPYFVSVPAPIGRGREAPSRVLVQDLSGVPPRLASLWVKKFVEQVAEPRTWDEVGLTQLVLLLRTRIAQEADAFPEYRNALVSLIVLR